MEIKIKDQLKNKKIKKPENIAKIMTDILNNESDIEKDKEHLWGIYLNARNNIKRIELIAIGALDAIIAHPREIFRPAVGCSAKSFIVCHNHPSGNTSMSKEDIRMAKELEKAGDIMGIKFIDSIVIGINEDCNSYKNY